MLQRSFTRRLWVNDAPERFGAVLTGRAIFTEKAERRLALITFLDPCTAHQQVPAIENGAPSQLVVIRIAFDVSDRRPVGVRGANVSGSVDSMSCRICSRTMAGNHPKASQ